MNKYKGITATVVYGAPYNPEFGQSDPWTVTLRYQGRRMTTPFYMGPALAREPNVEDVMEALCSDASSAERSFEEWCDDLGSDPDSRKAERVYNAVKKQTAKLRRLLGADFDRIVYSEDES